MRLMVFIEIPVIWQIKFVTVKKPLDALKYNGDMKQIVPFYSHLHLFIFNLYMILKLCVHNFREEINIAALDFMLVNYIREKLQKCLVQLFSTNEIIVVLFRSLNHFPWKAENKYGVRFLWKLETGPWIRQIINQLKDDASGKGFRNLK